MGRGHRYLMSRSKPLAERVKNRLRLFTFDRTNESRLRRLTREVKKNSAPAKAQAPVIFFNASTAINLISLNRAYSLLASWSLRLQGVPVVYFVCHHGMTCCILGTNRQDVHSLPPCDQCINFSKRIYAHGRQRWFRYSEDDELAKLVEKLDLPALKHFEYQGVPLGKLVFPSVCWSLRLYNLTDDERTRYLYREYILQQGCPSHRLKKVFQSQIALAHIRRR